MDRVFTNGSGDRDSIPSTRDWISILNWSWPQRLKKWYLILTCLTVSIIRYISRVKWSNLWKRVAPSPTPQCSSCWKRCLWVALDYGRQLSFHITIIIITIKSHCLHGFPWLSHAIRAYHPLLPAGLHPVSLQSCCMQVLVGRSTLARPCAVVHRRMSLIC